MTQNPYACNEDCTVLRNSHDGSKFILFIMRVAPPDGYDGPHLQVRDTSGKTDSVVAHCTSWTAASMFQVCIRTLQYNRCKIELLLNKFLHNCHQTVYKFQNF